MPIPAALRLLRPKQWTKNGLLLAALLFSERYGDPSAISRVGVGFFAFCLLSSAGYVWNDLRDIDADRHHPKKRLRPLASGEVSERAGKGIAVLALAAGIATAATLGLPFLTVAVTYLAITWSYSTWWKHTVLLDVMLIAAGFLVRAVAGAVAIPVETSAWFLCCIGFGALFIGLVKRQAEIRLLEGGAGSHRKILEEYRPELLHQLVTITVSCTVLSYALYTFSSGHGRALMATLPCVVYGMFRYLYLFSRGEGGEPETTILQDRPLQGVILLFVLVTILALRWGT